MLPTYLYLHRQRRPEAKEWEGHALNKMNASKTVRYTLYAIPSPIGVIGEVKSRKLFLLEVEIEGLEYCETLRYGTEMSAQLFPLSAS